jgi:hypothetical protein
MVSASGEFAGAIHFDTERSRNAPQLQSSNRMVLWVPNAAAAVRATTLCLCFFTCGRPSQVWLDLAPGLSLVPREIVERHCSSYRARPAAIRKQVLRDGEAAHVSTLRRLFGCDPFSRWLFCGRVDQKNEPQGR